MPATALREKTDTGENIAIDWLSDASGNASVTLRLSGFCVKAKTKPSAAAAPTANYDIVIYDPQCLTLDVMRSKLLNRHETNEEQVPTTLDTDVAIAHFNGGVYTVSISNAGSAKKGTLFLEIEFP
jgi:hypothetical protein